MAAVTAYNATISAQATAKGWAYIDPNPVLDSLRTAGEIPLFPNPPPELLELRPKPRPGICSGGGGVGALGFA